MDISLEGWDIQTAGSADWMPWGSHGSARAKILGSADGYMVTYVQADAGYEGDPHVHAHAEFFYLVEGSVRNQGLEMTAVPTQLRDRYRCDLHRDLQDLRGAHVCIW